MKITVRILIACILVITGVMGAMSVGVMATDAEDLYNELQKSEDQVAFIEGLSKDDRSALFEYLDKISQCKEVVTVTYGGGDRSSTSCQATRTGYYQGQPVYSHTLRVDWNYDGTYVWLVTITDSYNGGVYWPWGWEEESLTHDKDYNPTYTACDAWSDAKWNKLYLGFKVGEVDSNLTFTVYGNGSSYLW